MALSRGRTATRPATAMRWAARWTAIGAVALAAAGFLLWRLAFAHAPDATSAMASGRYADAAGYYAAAADTGDPSAQNALANLYYLGLGTEVDPGRAAALYFDAARQGYAPAQLNLGNLYAQGLGVRQDALRAFGWYVMADAHGSPAAEYYLRQISLEYTLSPLQQSTAAERWRTLDMLVAEGL